MSVRRYGGVRKAWGGGRAEVPTSLPRQKAPHPSPASNFNYFNHLRMAAFAV
jgi:hypothetical protein